MGLRGEISQRQRRFGEELQRLRMAAGLSAPEAGALVGMRSPAVSHTEAGRTGLNQERLAIWLDAYGCEDPVYQAKLADMGRRTGKGWWSEFADRVPLLALDLAEAEDSAALIDNYETFYLPGLLQLPAYAEAIYEGAHRDGKFDAEAEIDFRMNRQRILNDLPRRQFRFVIHETALRLRFPGDAVMRAQLTHLLEVAELPNVTIQVLPFAALKKPPHTGQFLLLDPGSEDLSTVVVDHPSRAEYLGDRYSIATYRRTFDQLSDLALPPVDTGRSPLALSSSRDSCGLIRHLLYLLQT
ncbi:helix-turn-helix transcriptional regulator [Kitasatospora purpeofusca]|uniref:helix-turn-helix domain-containing protein n=1 Tax=Kitasatospora purpeofusca TaxID=67352 RepID=UPI00224E27A1|nr:helix-turn-helix transcriptional regulator [Kitasatospora purpeofusca]MCX4685931.1 helix-turn-helix transcriptional regulator [Kitasatospora purpeofusca]